MAEGSIEQSGTPAIRTVMMPRDTNPQGTIFGGVILSLIDQAAFVEALRHASHTWVTVAMDQIVFHEPVRVGDVLCLWARTIRVGRTSLRVAVEVTAQRMRGDNEDVKVTEGEVTLVAIDDDGKPTPIGG
ncbi:MAG: acyl-CoA thioesterase [Planctomycetota bacterium]